MTTNLFWVLTGLYYLSCIIRLYRIDAHHYKCHHIEIWVGDDQTSYLIHIWRVHEDYLISEISNLMFTFLLTARSISFLPVSVHRFIYFLLYNTDNTTTVIRDCEISVITSILPCNNNYLHLYPYLIIISTSCLDVYLFSFMAQRWGNKRIQILSGSFWNWVIQCISTHENIPERRWEKHKQLSIVLYKHISSIITDDK